MTPEQYDRVQQIFLRARGASLMERESLLGEVDEIIRREVVSLLDADEGCGAFLLMDDMNGRTLPPASSVHNPQQIGPYRLLQQIGEGGFGSVFMAEQTTPVHRKVAIKLIKLGMDSKQVLARFQAERQALAMMDHSSIARFFDVGTTDNGSPYFVMELVRGIPIDEFCEKNSQSLTERLELFLQVCFAVHHAHRKGIIHRDLKPTNVLVGMGERAPVAKIIDFGIAKALDARLTEATLFTEFGQMVGTLEYMSPEQAEMSVIDIDTRSDVYSLGVMLYKLLTGTIPISREVLLKDGLFELPRVMRETEPLKPSTKVTAIRKGKSKRDVGLQVLRQRDLDWISMKCLAKDRRDRYDTANELANDLRRYLAGLPVSAHPPSFSYRASKFVRRNWGAATVALAIVLGTLLGVGGLFVGLRNAQQARRQAEKNLQDANESRAQIDLASRKLEETVYAELINSAQRAAVNNRAGRAKQLLEQAAPRLRGWEWKFVDSELQNSQCGLLRQSGLAAVNGIDTDAAGRLMVCKLASGKAEVRSATRDNLVRELPSKSRVTAVAFATETLLVGTDHGRITSFDIRDWQVVYDRELGSGGIYDIAVDLEDRQYAVCTGGGWIGLFDAHQHVCVGEWKLPVRLSGLLLKGGKVVGAGLDGKLYVMKLGEEGFQAHFISRSSLTNIGWLGEDSILVAASHDVLTINLAASGIATVALTQRRSVVSGLATGMQIGIVGRGDGVVLKVEDSLATLLDEFDASVSAVHWNQAGEHFLLGLSDGRVVTIDLPANKRSGDSQAGLTSIALPATQFVTANNEGWLTSLDAERDHVLISKQLHDTSIWNVAFDAHEHRLATVGEDFRIRGWKFPELEPRFEQATAWGVRDVCVAPDGSWIAGPAPANSNVREGTIGIWNFQGDCVRLLEGHTNWVLRFGVSRDGQFLVSGSEDQTTRVWNTKTWKTEHVLAPPLRSSPEYFAFGSSTELAIGHRDGRITFWNLVTGADCGMWAAFGDSLSGLFATPDKRLLATCRSSANLQVYSLERSEVVATLQLSAGYIEHFSVAPDGRTIGYAGKDGRLRTMRIQSRDPAKLPNRTPVR
ncbi:MAG: protein kinase [Planctomycetales bacterium]|nr:protein kinase [Planctomycetales bacterium]